MKSSVKRDQIVGAFLVALGVLYCLLTGKLDFPILPDYPGPKAFPYIAVFGLIVCGLGIFIQSTLSKAPQKTFMLREGWMDLIKSFLALVAYVVGLKFLGYFICTPLLLFVLSAFFARKDKVKLLGRAIFAVVVTAAVYAFYVYGFGMKLPVGSLFQ